MNQSGFHGIIRSGLVHAHLRLKIREISQIQPPFGRRFVANPSLEVFQRLPDEPRKKPSYFLLNPGWLIGILTMVYYNALYNWVV